MKTGLKNELAKLFKNGQEVINQFPQESKAMQVPKYSTSDLGLTPRQVTYWREKELFLSDSTEGSWHRFNLIDSVWIKLILKLKDYNYTVSQLQRVKEILAHEFVFDMKSSPELWDKLRTVLLELNADNVEVVSNIMASKEFQKDVAKYRLRVFDLIVQDVVLLRNHYRLLIDEKGNTLPFKKDNFGLYTNDSEEGELYKNFINKTHLSVFLNELVAELLDDISTEDKLNFSLLNQNELEVLNALSDKNVKNIEISFKGDKPLLKITKQEMPDVGKRIEEIILSNAYQEVRLVTQKGKIVLCENTEKRKLKPRE